MNGLAPRDRAISESEVKPRPFQKNGKDREPSHCYEVEIVDEH